MSNASEKLVKRLVRYLLCFVVASGVLFLLTPEGRYALTGLARGESFYKGRPTSYWRNEAKAVAEEMKLLDAAVLGKSRSQRVASIVTLNSRPTFYEPVRALINKLIPRRSPPVRPKGDDPAAIPVLLELLYDDDDDIRETVSLALSHSGESGLVVIARLQELLHDQSSDVRWAAFYAITRVHPQPEAVIQFSTDMLRRYASQSSQCSEEAW
jgi:hypothetical protein